MGPTFCLESLRKELQVVLTSDDMPSIPTEDDLEEDAPKVSSYVDLDTVYDFTENFLNTPWGGDYSGPQEYITHLEKDSPTAKDKTRDELIELLIKINYLKEK